MILVDSFEPEQMLLLIRHSENSTRMALNARGRADYFFTACDGHSIQIERKQAAELLSEGLSEVEDQLRRQYPNADESILLIEGVIGPSEKGCAAYRRAKDGKVFYRQRSVRTSYSGLMAWIWRLDKSGISVYFTSDLAGTAKAITAIYRSAQKEEHKTLNRYVKPKIYLADLDPFIKTLMGIEGVDLGEKLATRLIEEFGCPINVMLADEEELQEIEGIGPGIVRQLMDALGRVV